jgi:uncharacterized protein (TIGR02300 family)
MKNVNLGNRRLCSNCGIKFYDFDRPVPACPKCGSKAQKSKFSRLHLQKMIDASIESDEMDIVPDDDIEVMALDNMHSEIPDFVE